MYKAYLKGCRQIHELDPRGWVDQKAREVEREKLLSACAALLLSSKSATTIKNVRGIPARLAAMEARAAKELSEGH